MIKTVDKVPETYLPRYVNNWLSMKSKAYATWNDGTSGAGMPATRIQRACAGTDINWIAMCAVAAVKSDYWRHGSTSYFACSLGGIYDDQILQAKVEWPKVTNVEDLKLNEAEISMVNQIYSELNHNCERMAEASSDHALPEPIKPKPIPLPPLPPVPVEAPKEPVVPPTNVPTEKPGWKKTALTVAGFIGGSLFLVKLFAPAVVVMGLELLQRVLQMIGG